MYDVTDFAELLKGEVDISAGNQQELIDLRFVMIKGTPAREVKRIQQIWHQATASYRYKNLDNDVNCEPKKVKLLDDAKSFKVRSILSGHGHNSDDGISPIAANGKTIHIIFTLMEKKPANGISGGKIATSTLFFHKVELGTVHAKDGVREILFRNIT
jgi:hypothetical protein